MTGDPRRLAAVLQVASGVAPAGDAADAGDGPRPLPADASDLVRRHGLAPLAFRAGHARFRADYVRSSLAAALRERDLAEAVAALAAAHIPAILLKGVSYAPTLYADPALRPMTDIDLMVPAAAHADAAKALCRLGYWHAGGAADQAATHHAITLKRARGAVDLHRRIVAPWRARIDEAALWRRARPAAERTDGALRLAPGDELLVHLVHIARHELMVPLINYVDTARLLARDPAGVDRLAELAASYRVRRGVDAALRATRSVIDGAQGEVPAWRRGAQPSREEIASAGRVWRPLQLVRKALLVDGPVQLAGLAAVTVCERVRRP